MNNITKDEDVFRRDNFRCVYCDFDGSSFEGWAFLQVDHFVPRSKGGTHEMENLKTSCRVCNHMKGDRLFSSMEDAREEIRKWWQGMRAYWEINVRSSGTG